MDFRLLFLCVVLKIIHIYSMSLNGQSLTRYDPCGLGIIQLDKTVTERVWSGVINFDLYPNLVEAEVRLHFVEPVVLAWGGQNSSLRRTDGSTDLLIKPSGPIPKRFIFYVLVTNQDSIPFLNEFSLNNQTLCNQQEKNAQTIDSLNIPGTEDTTKHVCGRRSINHTELVTTGSEAKDGEWPWHVAIFIKEIKNDTRVYQCGGSIISSTAILTAGHCITRNGITTEAHRVIILAGITDLSDPNAVGLQTLYAKQMVLHPSYTDAVATADLAVIKVDRIEFTEFVQPICIWGPAYDKRKLFGTSANMVGFGRTETGELSQILRASTTMVQTDDQCIAYATKLYQTLLNEFTFCTGFGPAMGVNPRNGDSGGGLTIAVMQPDHKISYFLRGVLSKCGMPVYARSCDPAFYVVYTDVGPHYSWIFHHAGLQYTANIV